MADHGLDYQPEERVVAEINDLKRQVAELRTLQRQGASAVNLQILDYTNISISIPGNTEYFINAFLTSTTGAKVFAAPAEWALYQGTRSSANNLEHVANSFILNWDYRMYRGSYLSDGNNVAEVLLIRNTTAGVLTLILDIRWRYLIDSATPS